MVLYLVTVGFASKPAIAEDVNISAVGKQIEKQLTPAKQPTWDEVIAPQLVERDNQVARKQEEERTAREAAAEATKQAQVVQVVSYSGNCASWLVEAGVTDIANAMKLISRESGCNPNAVNSSSGACGLGQQLPCGKWAHQWNDPVGGLVDMQQYVFGRYGSWANALAWHYSHNWY